MGSGAAEFAIPVRSRSNICLSVILMYLNQSDCQPHTLNA